MNFSDELKNYIKARYPLLLIETVEEDRLFSDIEKIAKSLGHKVVTWSSVSGLNIKTHQSLQISTLSSDLDTCEDIAKSGEPTIFVFFDASLSAYERRFKEFAINIRHKGYRCNFIIISTSSDISKDIASEVTVLDYPLPDRESIKKQIKRFMDDYQDEEKAQIDTSPEVITALTDAAIGLTHAEIENCLSRALVEDHCLDINDVKSIVKEKKQIIRKSGILEYIENSLSLEDTF